MIEAEIRTAINAKKLIIGLRRTIKELKLGKIKKVVIANNCPTGIKNDLEHDAKLSSAAVEIFDGDSASLGSQCGKPFKATVVGIKK